MTDTIDIQKKRSEKMAAVAVAMVAAFSLAFIGLIVVLEDAANRSVNGRTYVAEATSAEPFYVLLIGSDSRKETALYTGKKTEHAQVDQHSDVMTLMRVDPETYTVTLASVPRDTVLKGSSTKINNALLDNNPEEVVEAVESLTGVDIPYYMMATFTSFQVFIDAIGGVTVDVPKDVKVPDSMTAEDVKLSAGKSQHLDGSEALVLARARKEYVVDQDALRQANVRNLEVAILQKALSVSDEEGVNDLLADLAENVVTNLDISEVGYLVADFITNRDLVTIYSCTGPWRGGENMDGLWVVEEDPETWAELMAVVDAGGSPVGIVEEPKHL